MNYSFRAAVLSCALFFTAAASSAQTNDLIDLEFGTLDHFDIATWNIEWFPKNGETTIEYVAEIIEELELDVIAIQEIDEPEEFEYLLSLLQGYEGHYQDGEYARLGFIYNTQSVTVNEQYEIFDSGMFSNPFPRPPMVLELTFMDDYDFVVINNHYKCCGDGTWTQSDYWDEESRRAHASVLLRDYMDLNFENDRVIMLGDLNDLLTDAPPNNVFMAFLNNSENYRFADMDIATGPSSQWSYPSWPSHLDHILISNELFPALEDSESQVTTIAIDDYFPGGWSGYDNNVSDHLPVGFSFDPSTTALSTFEDVNETAFNLFPNPTNGMVSITIADDFRMNQIRIIDSQGRLVDEISITANSAKHDLDLNRLPVGVYSIQLLSEEGSVRSKKLVLMR